MAERTLIIEGREKDISTGPAVPISNSHKTRIERGEEDDIQETRPSAPVKKERPKVESVVNRRSEIRKETFGSKLKRAWIGDKSFGEAAEDAVLDVWVPGIKATLFDGFFSAIEMILFGSVSGRRVGDRSARQAGYNAMYRGATRDRDRDRDDRVRRREDVGEIWENVDPPLSRQECLNVLSKMRERADVCEYATVADLLGFEGFEDKDISWTDEDRCWYYEDLRSDRVEIVAVRGGYILSLPRPRKTPDGRGYRR